MSAERETTSNPAAPVNRLRVLSWNLDHFPDDRGRRLGYAAERIVDSGAQIVCVQETDPVTLDQLATLTGLGVASSSAYGCGILTSLECHERFSRSFDEPHRAEYAGAVLSNGCHRVVAVSAHLSWGSGREHLRLAEAVAIDAHVATLASFEPHRDGTPIAVLAGDFNAESGSATVRYLKGLGVENGTSTHWTDAWIRGEGAGVTSSPGNPLAGRTAGLVGLDAGLGGLPERRIDYIMVRGYAYARAGAPLKTSLVGLGDGERSASDHYGVLTELYC